MLFAKNKSVRQRNSSMGLRNEMAIKSPEGIFRFPVKPRVRITKGINDLLEKNGYF